MTQMYYPYFRGKQYELITLRENAASIRDKKIMPILEPVKENLSSLKKCIEALKSNRVPFIFVINPKFGDFKNDNTELKTILDEGLGEYGGVEVGYIINESTELLDICSFLKSEIAPKLSLIHYGFPEGKKLSEQIKTQNLSVSSHVFIEKCCGRLYRRNFDGSASKKILIKDGFEKQKNADYPEDQRFSDLHITYEEEGVVAFGDFLTVGDDYSESGGPAYAIAIHLTYFSDDDDMHIKHFVSDRVDSPVDPAGKFLEALEKLNTQVDEEGSKIEKTDAVKEFQSYYERAHFPGLGYVKKLSMQHHLEILVKFLNRDQ
jgi:hypothetical protein